MVVVVDGLYSDMVSVVDGLYSDMVFVVVVDGL